MEHELIKLKEPRQLPEVGKTINQKYYYRHLSFTPQRIISYKRKDLGVDNQKYFCSPGQMGKHVLAWANMSAKTLAITETLLLKRMQSR